MLKIFILIFIYQDEISFDVKEILSYDFFNAVDPDETDNNSESEGSRVGIWSIGQRAIDDGIDIEVALKHYRQNKSRSRVMFMIGIDCSAPPETAVQSLLKWLQHVRTSALSLYEEQTSQSPSGVEKRTLSNILADLSSALIVVMCKADYLNTADINVMKTFKSLQGSIRAICLDCQATVIYTSAASELNCIKLQKYILSTLYKDDLKISLELCIEDGIGSAFVPAGLDSEDLISIATGVTVSDILADLKESQGAFDSAGPQDHHANDGPSNSSSESMAMLSIESEQEWLAKLKKFVSLAEATSSAGDSSILSSSGAKAERSIPSKNITATADAAAGGSVTETTTAKPVVASRRASRASISAKSSGGQDPADFFKNLLGADNKTKS